MLIWRRRRVVIVSFCFSIIFTCLVLLKAGNNTIPDERQSLERNHNLQKRNETKLKHLKTSSSYGTNSRVIPILLSAYFRTGSTLLGEILQQDNRVFYVYEPLISLYKAFDNPNPVQTLINGTSIALSEQTFASRAVAIVESYFNCKFDGLDVTTISHGFQYFGKKPTHFLACVEKANKTSSLLKSIQTCLQILQRHCHQSNYIIIKVTRLPAVLIDVLIPKFPKLQILHLVRDPRATLLSLDKLGASIAKRIETESRNICSLIHRNAEHIHYLNKTHPTLVFRVFYENLARQPLKYSSYIFKHYDLKFTNQTQKYIKRITMSGLPDECSNCYVRANSSAHVDIWKNGWTKEQLSVIERQCKPLLLKFGYSFLTGGYK